MTQRGEIVWSPDAHMASESRLASFARGKSFDELHQWSVKSPEEFWSSIWQFCGMVGERGDRVVTKTPNPSDPAVEFISTRFFPDAKLSIVENFLQRTGDGEALVAIDETGKRRTRSWDELRQRVANLASALEHLGIESGDRVAVWLPNSIEAIETMLAAASLG
ncbi:MAG: AMP-binding protein, partial [Ilumatobacteraceae bacterium]|nr:AMP-binding protein [Ilumatobacteraceae bacterium]